MRTTPLGLNTINTLSSSVPAGLAFGATSLSGLTIVQSGTGYNLGDTGKLQGGTGLPGQYIVTAINQYGGVIGIQVNPQEVGFYTTNPGSNINLATTPLTGNGVNLQVQATYTSGTANIFPSQATSAIIQPTVSGLAWTNDGSTPSTTRGLQIAAGDTFVFTDQPLSDYLIIALSSGTIVNVLFQSGY